MRRVHLFCYYCGKDFPDQEEMEVEKNGSKLYLRAAKSNDNANQTEDTLKDNLFAKELDQKIQQRLKNPKLSEVFTGKKMIEEYTEIFYAENTNKINEEKYKCKLCPKAFKAEKFVQKHLATRHPENLQRSLEKAIDKQFLENYLNDPDKPLPPQPTVPNQQSFSSYYPSSVPHNVPRHFNRPQPHHEEVEQEEEEKDPRPLTDYMDMDKVVAGMPSIDIILGISK